MDRTTEIPAFSLYGETDPFPDVVHCESYSARAPSHGWRILPHRHSQMSQLFLIEAGGAQAEFDGRREELTPGTFLYIPEYCVHGFKFEPGTLGDVISFPLQVAKSMTPPSAEMTAHLSKPAFGVSSELLQVLVGHLRKTTASPSEYRDQMAVSLAHSVLSELARIVATEASSAKDEHSGRLRQLDRLISENHSKGWTSSDFAREMAVSRGHLSRLCRSHTGLGAAAYIERRRMDEAQRLLAFPRLPVGQIGFRLGYEDPSYFSRRFKAVCGSTPVTYRERFTS